MFAIEITDPGRDFPCAPLTNALLEETLFVSQIEIHHGNGGS
jgi:hypothetical protein